MEQMPLYKTGAERRNDLAATVPPQVCEGFEVAEQRLAEKFGIASEFIRVPTLSKMLSLSANAIYTQMRNGSFPIPHKKVGNVVVVRFHDFVHWYCADWHMPAAAVPFDDAGPEENVADSASIPPLANAADTRPLAFTLGRDDESFELYRKNLIARIKAKPRI